jgi:hypothetical protein
MGSKDRGAGGQTYDRDFLLSAGKRNQLMELWEVEKFGRDSFGDPDHVRLYGMTPAQWHGRGVRLLARTVLEAVSDPLGDAIGADIARVVGRDARATKIGVLDPFAGSCNGLYAILRHLPGATGIGFEYDPTIFDLTRRNIASLGAPIALYQGDYRQLLPLHKFPDDHAVVAFLAPPWGDALNPEHGLDLARTKPPIAELVDDIERVYGGRKVLYVTQVHQHLEPTALAALKGKFDWTSLSIYDVNVEGMQHGVLMAMRRWLPMKE